MKSSRLTLILVACALLFYSALIKPTQTHIFNVAFTDELDNFATGDWILRGKVLYKDLFFQHQPITTVISAAIQKVTHPNSSYMLIKRHREFLFLFSAASFLFLIIRFGYVALIMAFLFELVKFRMIGNLFLSESLVVPAILFTSALIFKVTSVKEKVTKLDLFIFVLSLFYIQFSLLPMAPFVLISALVMCLSQDKKLRVWILKVPVMICIFLFLSLLKIIDIVPYIKYTVLVSSSQNASWEIGNSPIIYLAKILFLPLNILNLPNDDFNILLKLISLAYIFFLIFLIYKKKYITAILSFLLLTSVNARPNPLNIHGLIPAYTMLIWLTLLQIDRVIRTVPSITKRAIIASVSIGIFIVTFAQFGIKEINSVSDRESMWFEHYSPSRDYGQAIKYLSSYEDTMLTVEERPLMYWESRLFPSSRYFFSYSSVVYPNEMLKKEFTEDMLYNPPTFLFYEGGSDNFDLLFGNNIFHDYCQIKKNNLPAYLYVLKSRKISDEKWESIKLLGFDGKNLECSQNLS